MSVKAGAEDSNVKLEKTESKESIISHVWWASLLLTSGISYIQMFQVKSQLGNVFFNPVGPKTHVATRMPPPSCTYLRMISTKKKRVSPVGHRWSRPCLTAPLRNAATIATCHRCKCQRGFPYQVREKNRPLEWYTPFAMGKFHSKIDQLHHFLLPTNIDTSAMFHSKLWFSIEVLNDLDMNFMIPGGTELQKISAFPELLLARNLVRSDRSNIPRIPSNPFPGKN